MVRFLASYINNRRLCNEGSYWISVEKEIENYKRINPNRTPTIIFDLFAATTILIRDEREILSAGRQVVCMKRAEFLFQKLRSLGVDLVFFKVGPITPLKLPAKLQKANDRYKEQEKVFESLRQGEEINLKDRGQILSSYFDNFLIAARNYGKIFVSLHNEFNIDLAAYATKIHATAVFATNTDFLIMPGDWPIWSPLNFNFETFETTAWNKKSLRLALNLRQNQMPIFSILSGNDRIPFEKVQHIHERLKGGVRQERLAEFIRGNFHQGINLSKSGFEKLVGMIYNNGTNGYSIEEATNVVNMSLESYDYSHHAVRDIQPDWLKKHIDSTGSSFVYMLMNELPIMIHQSFIDLSNSDVQPYSELALPIVRRQMGIAYYGKGINDIEKTICLKPSHEEPFQKQLFSPLFPDKPIPSLPALIGYEEDEDLTLKRKCEILCWAISPRKEKFNVDSVMKLINTPYLAPVLILNYLLKEFQITMEEADVVLLSIHESIQYPPDKLERINPPELFRERPFWIAFVFVRLVKLFSDSMLICGLFDYIQHGYFDGYIFHKMYNKFLSMEHERKQKLVEPINEYRLYAE